jgi:hypothetical protein
MTNKGHRVPLTPPMIAKLNELRILHRLSFAALVAALGAPFGGVTMQNALHGRALWEQNYIFLRDWLVNYDAGKITLKLKSAESYPGPRRGTQKAIAAARQPGAGSPRG